MNVTRVATAMALDAPPWLTGLQARLKDSTMYGVHHLDQMTFSLLGSAVADRQVVPVTFMLSSALSVTTFAMAGEASPVTRLQTFRFVDADRDVVDLVLSLVPLETIQ